MRQRFNGSGRGALLAALLTVLTCGAGLAGAAAQPLPHTPAISGMPHGVPLFCSEPTVTSAASGAWSDPRTWSVQRAPGADDRVVIEADHDVAYDAVSNAALDCLEIRGALRFATDSDTRMKVVTVTVREEGHLEVGSAGAPVAAGVTAEIIIADRLIDTSADPAQVGNGLISLGKVTMHGAVRTPTFVRTQSEPLAGDETIELERPASGWRPGDYVVIPDTRQLRAAERRDANASQTEKVRVAAVAGTQVTLAAPLRHDHRGARDAEGAIALLPHVGNLSRNVVVRSENPDGTRGHTMFLSHADVDLRYVAFHELGRTRNGSVDNARFATDGRVSRLGTNQIGRYAVHFHHYFGPRTAPENGHQFTLIGNAVDGAPKWGVTVHRTHYGLVQDNVVYNTRGAGIATEDGSESFNVFDHNFSVQSPGRSASRLSGGYGGSLPDLGVVGAGFWFRGPNNYIRNNVAANAGQAGFAFPEMQGSVRTPAFKGADTSKADESVRVDLTNAAVLEFAGNEAYGTIENGLESDWNGTVAHFRTWHASRHGVMGSPPETLVVDGLVVRGDPAALGDPSERPVGVWISNYVSRSVSVTGADVQGMRVGVLSPFFYNQAPEPGRGPGSLVIEDGYFRNQVGVSVATAYAANASGGEPLKSAVVSGSVFEPLDTPAADRWPAESISMNYEMAPGDGEPRDPIVVRDYNGQPGNSFRVYYSHEAPESTAPCQETIPGIGGWVCE